MKKQNINQTKLNLYIDLIMSLAFVVMMEEQFTGLRIHELLGLAIIVVFVTHIVLHWRWIVSITKTFFVKLFHQARLNYVINLALFIDMVIVVVTGILISKTLGLDFGGMGDGPIHMIHLVSSYLVLIIVGLHAALHWEWIVTHSKKYLFNFRLLAWKPKPVNRDAVSDHSNLITKS